MKKISILLVVFSFILLSCNQDKVVGDFAEIKEVDSSSTYIPKNEALEIAKEFIKANEIFGPETKSTNYNLSFSTTDVEATKSSSEKPAYYIFNIAEGGYIIVSGSKIAYPVLGYSAKGSFDLTDVPKSMSSLLSAYSQQVNKSRELGLKLTDEIKQANASCYNQDVLTKRGKQSIAPLLGDIEWNQNPYYNDLCPTVKNKKSPVGCAALAVCQVMRYYKYPKSGKGRHSYRDKSSGSHSFNYNYSINWDAMPKGTLKRANKEIAKFCYGVGVGLDMTYGAYGSATLSLIIPKLLTKHYRYPRGVKYLTRDVYSKRDWVRILYDQLSHKRPLVYSGHSSRGGGHAFVCDGYNSRNGYFHFNWGWGGKSNGYFQLDALAPSSLGTGGGNGGYTKSQSIITNFAPPSNRGSDISEPRPIINRFCTSKGRYTKYGYIKSFKFGSKTSRTRNTRKGYINNTGERFYIRKGGMINFDIQPGFSGKKSDLYWTLYLDLNSNKHFGEKEICIKYKGTKGYSGKFPLPQSMPRGSYRMRLTVKHGDYAKPCDTFKYGQVQDYTLVIN